ncbi:MAG: protein NO VEIN domain-containing protein [Janthinobacterium lividum]
MASDKESEIGQLSPMDEAHKRALVVAYFLSRCDRKGFQSLGFATWNSAYAGIGAALGVPSATVKHMRDSFDPYCSPVRKGWYQRPVLRSRVQVMEAYSDVGDAALFEVARDIVFRSAEATGVYTAPIVVTDKKEVGIMGDNLAYAARLRTGEAAEEYFKSQYPYLPQFDGMELEDTRKLGTGFDFRVHSPKIVQAVEVKGIVGMSGSIAFTDKEWAVAHYLKHDYILALVRSLNTAPALELTIDPAAQIAVTKRSIETISIYWSAKV